MKILLPGGTGFLGRHIGDHLVARGDAVVVLTRGRSANRDGRRFVTWDSRTLGEWASELEQADAVVHLSGKRVDCRPTRANINELIRSRVQSVTAIGNALQRTGRVLPIWVQTSTLAIYGETGDAVIDESTVPSGVGPRQMVTVALAWEHAFRHFAHTRERAVLIRPSIAIGGDDDPATTMLARLARFGLGGPAGSGSQWVSWISLDDLVQVFVRALDDTTMTGTYHATSPTPLTNADMMACVREAVGRSVGLPAPALVARVGALALGADPALVLTGRRGVPTRLLAEGFAFTVQDFSIAVRRALDGSVTTAEAL